MKQVSRQEFDAAIKNCPHKPTTSIVLNVVGPQGNRMLKDTWSGTGHQTCLDGEIKYYLEEDNDLE